MNEFNQNLAENLGAFLLEFSDDVVKGIKEYIGTRLIQEIA